LRNGAYRLYYEILVRGARFRVFDGSYFDFETVRRSNPPNDDKYLRSLFPYKQKQEWYYCPDVWPDYINLLIAYGLDRQRATWYETMIKRLYYWTTGSSNGV
jgi:hypothetical protein